MSSTSNFLGNSCAGGGGGEETKINYFQLSSSQIRLVSRTARLGAILVTKLSVTLVIVYYFSGNISAGIIFYRLENCISG